ncbi:enoyl-CoA hydratase/isomerase family protein [Silvibacterium acidisoli]|uniref:enoyl-CoA hydratase/isomerase family protein n=1 Tax=Acidobacteriaceae bacterium ZG23-2 TaxID=2883246 RepID=UPI00406CECCB
MSSFRFEQHGSVGKLTLIGDASAPDADYPASLRASVRQAYESDIRVLHISSESGNFAVADNPAVILTRGSAWLEAFAADVLASYRMIEEMRVPTVASVSGMALGGGFELLLSCDFLVAAESSLLLFPEGMVAGLPLAGGIQRLADRVGRARATRFVLLSEPIPGKIAGDLGIATHVVADADLKSTADQLVQRLATGPTLAYGKMKALLRAWSSGGVGAADGINAEVASGLADSEHGKQGAAAAIAALKKGELPSFIEFKGK